MVEELCNLVLGNEGIIIKLHLEHKFDKILFEKIKHIILNRVNVWKENKIISLKEFLIIVELTECLVGGNRFLSYEEQILIEDASLEIKDIINSLY